MRIALIGCGGVANRWVRTLLSHEYAQIAALIDPSPGTAAALAARHGLTAPICSRLAELGLIGADAIANLTPPALHAEVSSQALTAGLHVLSEKPLATSLRDAIGLVSLAGSRSRTLTVMQNRGLDPGLLAFGRVIRERSNGPLSIAADVAVPLPAPGFRGSFPGPVAVTDLAVHAFDQVRQLVAAPAIAVSCTETPARFLGPHCTVAVATVTLADGSLFTYRGGFTGGAPGTPANGTWRIEAEGFAAGWDGQQRIRIQPRPGDDPEYIQVKATAPAYATCIGEMLAEAAGHGPSRCTAAGNLPTIALMDAAVRSASTAQRIEVEPIEETRNDER
jgi:predicted dehydrogenase